MSIIEYEDGSIENLSPAERNKKLKERVTKRCIECIANDSYVRVGYVVKKEMGLTEPLAFYKSIAHAMRNTGKYNFSEIKFEGKDDFNIWPEKKKTWIEIHRVLYDFILIISTATLSLIAGWLLQMSDKKEAIQLEKKQNESIQMLKDSITSIEKHITDFHGR